MSEVSQDTSLESLVERMETAYQRTEKLRAGWKALGIVEGRSQAFHLVAAMSEATPKTLQNLTRLETLYEVMVQLREGDKPCGC